MSYPQLPVPQGTPPPQTPRERYREVMSRRQMKVFGTLIAVMSIALVLALLGMAGILPTPFGAECSKKVVYAKVGDTPCPTENARPISPAGIKVQVLNASSTSGLAGTVGNFLTEQGYEVILVDNSPEAFRGNIQVESDAATVDSAYSLARYFDMPQRIKLAQLPTGTITVILGEAFDGLPSEETVESLNSSNGLLVPLRECAPVDPALLVPGTSTQQSGQSAQAG